MPDRCWLGRNGGAAAMCGLSALRGGAGLVKVVTDASAQSVITGLNPGLMTAAFETQGNATKSCPEDLLAWASCLAIGPGLGVNNACQKLVVDTVGSFDRPLVIDADGLNALAPLNQSCWPRTSIPILTPHPGEFSRLFPECDSKREQMIQYAKTKARELNAIIVLKGHQTYVTDGQQDFTNSTGNPGMATGGSGDVLTGIIAAFLAQGLPSFEAAKTAVICHGIAGDLAAEDYGQVSLIATDLISYLPDAFEFLRMNLDALLNPSERLSDS